MYELKVISIISLIALLFPVTLGLGYHTGKAEVYEKIFASQLHVNINPVALEKLE